MRPESPDGGTADYILDFRERGLCSTTEVGRSLGFALPATFITSRLGVQPEVVVRSGIGFYWTKAQVSQIRRALIKLLLDEEFRSAPPSDHHPV